MTTVRTQNDLLPVLKRLRLSGILETLDLRNREAVDDRLSHNEFLYRILNDEVERREAKQLDLRLRRASFESERGIEDFDWSFNPTIPKPQIIDLATTNFVRRHENVLLVGPTGVGKSHIAQAIGRRACAAGHDVHFVTAERMLAGLRAARADNSYERAIRKLTKPAVLIVDDLGLRPLSNNEPLDLYDVIRQRYERGSIVLTTNRGEKELYGLFGDELLASAAMDRLLHHAHVLRLDGESYRQRPAD